MSGNVQLPRRTFLHGVGAAVALPWLDVMMPRVGFGGEVAAKPPVRTGFMFFPNGVIPSAWTPKDVGEHYTLSPTLEPLADVRSEVLVLSGLAQTNGRPLGDGAGDHARAAASFLTGAHPYKTDGSNIRAGVSVDQYAAERIGRHTPLPSLELGIDPGGNAGSCDSGYSCAYSSNVSWKSPNTPAAKEINPKLVFQRMFGVRDANPRERARRDDVRKSILDLVRDDSLRLKQRLGDADRRKIEEYFTGVRELEQRIEMAARTADRKPADFPTPAGVPDDFGKHVQLMFDLLTLAFQTDVTRTATFMFGNAGGNRAYTMLGVKDGHHSISHHQDKEPLVSQLRKIDRYHVAQFAAFVERLRSVKEGSGTLLDQCLIMYGSGLGDGNAHTHHNLPILLAGRGGGTVRPGRHIRFKEETPLNNLFVSILDRAGVPVEQFGDSTGRLKELSSS